MAIPILQMYNIHENDSRFERFGKDRRCPKREQHPPKKWRKSYILLQFGEEWANVAFFDDHLILNEALRSKDESKWEAAL